MKVQVPSSNGSLSIIIIKRKAKHTFCTTITVLF